jgi:thymidylate synthase
MHLTTRNVNSAFRELVKLFDRGSRWAGGDSYVHTNRGIVKATITQRNSRNGPVLLIDEPVTITYTHPRERVLFNAARDANPFFHLYEALWMLAGRNDVASVAHYAKQMKDYSDDGVTLNGAYGYRWRHQKGEQILSRYMKNGPGYDDWENIDQLDVLVNHLKADHNSRRAVLQMWNVEDDLLRIGGKCICGADRTGPSAEAHDVDCPAQRQASKDTCCNLSVMFSIREQVVHPDAGPIAQAQFNKRCLDMTVTNRSNDLIWGLLGANYVHFSFLQEYMAARIGVEVGKYHHFTNNLHVYTETNSGFHPEKWLGQNDCNWHEEGDDLYHYSEYDVKTTVPLINKPEVFENEMLEFVNNNDGRTRTLRLHYKEPFLDTVAQPAMDAMYCHKEGNTDEALTHASMIAADDWRIACQRWLERRKK